MNWIDGSEVSLQKRNRKMFLVVGLIVFSLLLLGIYILVGRNFHAMFSGAGLVSMIIIVIGFAGPLLWAVFKIKQAEEGERLGLKDSKFIFSSSDGKQQLLSLDISQIYLIAVDNLRNVTFITSAENVPKLRAVYDEVKKTSSLSNFIVAGGVASARREFLTIELPKKLSALGKTLKVVDRKKLIRILDSLNPKNKQIYSFANHLIYADKVLLYWF